MELMPQIDWRADLSAGRCQQGWEHLSGYWRDRAGAIGPEAGGVAVVGERFWRDITVTATVAFTAGDAGIFGVSWGHNPEERFVKLYHQHDFAAVCFLFEVNLRAAEAGVYRCLADGQKLKIAGGAIDAGPTGVIRIKVATDIPDVEAFLNGKRVIKCSIHDLFNQIGKIGLWSDGPARFSDIAVRSTPKWRLCKKPVTDNQAQPFPTQPGAGAAPRDILEFHPPGGRVIRIANPKRWREKKKCLLRNLLWLYGRPPKTVLPLESRVLDEVELPEYSRKKILIAAAPGSPIHAYLFVPSGLTAPAPAVIASSTCRSKYIDLHQTPALKIRHYAEELARRGYVTLTFDAPGHGERPEPGKRRGYCSDYLRVVGDIRRCVDYLQSLPVVDPDKIGLMGHSRGGWISSLAGIFEPRLAAVAISGCRPGLAQYGPKCLRAHVPGEQLFRYDCAQNPVDDHEILAMNAPMPLLFLASRKDWHVPVAGCRRIYREAKKVYRLLKAENHIAFYELDFYHGLDERGRAAAYLWFDRWLKGRPPATGRQLEETAALIRKRGLPAVEARAAASAGRILLAPEAFTGGGPPPQGDFQMTDSCLTLRPGGKITAVFRLDSRPTRPPAMLVRGSALFSRAIKLKITVNHKPVFVGAGLWRLPRDEKNAGLQPLIRLARSSLKTGKNRIVLENVSAPDCRAGELLFCFFYSIIDMGAMRLCRR